MIVKPFRGLRPAPELADRVPSPPYDVMDSDEARAMAQGDPHTFLHVIRAEIDLPPGTGSHDERVYATAAKNLHEMIERRWLVQDPRPAYYVYRQIMGDHTQVGIVGAAAVEDYENGRIKKHEHTRPEKEDDRVRLNQALGANPGPVFLTYRPLPELNALIDAAVAAVADVDFVAPDDVRHTLWVVDDDSTCMLIEELFSQLPCSYVADGHHRSAAAARVSRERIAALESPSGDEGCRFFMAAHFPADQLQVLDYNRLVRDLNGLTAEALLDRIEKAGFHVQPDHRGRRPTQRESFGMYLAGRWYLLGATPALIDTDDAVRRLDVSILSDHLLQPILGIGDPRTDQRIDFVGGIRGMDELERRVDSGDYAVAFGLFPTSLEQVMQVADAGQVMPPKSTWFEPKLRSGMVVQRL